MENIQKVRKNPTIKVNGYIARNGLTPTTQYMARRFGESMIRTYRSETRDDEFIKPSLLPRVTLKLKPEQEEQANAIIEAGKQPLMWVSINDYSATVELTEYGRNIAKHVPEIVHAKKEIEEARSFRDICRAASSLVGFSIRQNSNVFDLAVTANAISITELTPDEADDIINDPDYTLVMTNAELDEEGNVIGIVKDGVRRCHRTLKYLGEVRPKNLVYGKTIEVLGKPTEIEPTNTVFGGIRNATLAAMRMANTAVKELNKSDHLEQAGVGVRADDIALSLGKPETKPADDDELKPLPIVTRNPTLDLSKEVVTKVTSVKNEDVVLESPAPTIADILQGRLDGVDMNKRYYSVNDMLQMIDTIKAVARLMA